MKILTFDIEEWFHILDNPETKSISSWNKYPSRLRHGVDTILEVLANTNQRATFFCLGWVAEKCPEVIKSIDDAGFHIASHSYAHQLAYEQDEKKFRNDLRRSISVLQDITGKVVNCYRAPGFSIIEENLWMYELLLDEGIEIDCSLFPGNRAHGGLPHLANAFPSVGKWDHREMKLFPINTRKVLGRNLIYSGGGYFRLFPSRLVQKWVGEDDYVMTYFHPRDFDDNQPIVPGLSPARRFKSYVGISSAKKKLTDLLLKYPFVDVAKATTMIDWQNTPIVNLRTGRSD